MAAGLDPTGDEHPYPSRRSPVLARSVVATSQPLAAQAGLRMLQEGGSAVDAALAAALALTVVEPSSNGIGGDLFALVWDGAELHGLNASGRAPRRLDVAALERQGEVPALGWAPVTVPGAPSGWVELSRRFGRLPLARVAQPAIDYARGGFPLGPLTARAWRRAETRYRGFDAFAATFLPGGRAPRVGETVTLPDHAATLEAIAASDGAAFYRGALAERMAAQAVREGGALREDDLAEHRPEWVVPLRQAYRGVELVELPPNGQGLIALQALGMLAHHELAGLPPDGADAAHLQIEALKAAFADARRWLADPEAMELPPERLLDPAYLAERAAALDPARAGSYAWGRPPRGGTVYVVAADAQGRVASLIQSNYQGFGSGVVVHGTGIALQNRGAGFTLAPGHPNRAAGGKRPFHTIVPAMLMEDGRPGAAFGVIGGHVQAQMHVQLTVRLADHRQAPQAAIDAPRWHLTEGGEVAVERGVAPEVVAELRRRGHRMVVDDPAAPRFFGGAQLAMRLPGGWLAASDGRREGQAVGA
jgi:gamma-glutamyltranspeptidase/glutathione hydrolase